MPLHLEKRRNDSNEGIGFGEEYEDQVTGLRGALTAHDLSWNKMKPRTWDEGWKRKQGGRDGGMEGDFLEHLMCP